MPPDIQTPQYTMPIVDKEGRQTQEFNSWADDITKLDLLVGTGSPEGVISAIQGRKYMDDAGTAGAITYIKRDSDIGGDDTQGWILT